MTQSINKIMPNLPKGRRGVAAESGRTAAAGDLKNRSLKRAIQKMKKSKYS